MSPHLPLEVWDRVIDHLWDDHASLDACSRTCSAWLGRTRVHVFRSVQARVHCEQDCDRIAALRAPHTMRPLRYIGMLNLGRSSFFHAEPDADAQARWLDDKLPPLVSALVGVDTLHLSNVVWATAVPRALEECLWPSWLRIYLVLTPAARRSIQAISPQVRTLVLGTVWFEGHGMLQDFLTGFSGLVKLDLQDITIRGPPHPGARTDTTALDLSALKHLSVLQLRVASILRQDGALDVLASRFAPSLSEVRVLVGDLAQSDGDRTRTRAQWRRWDAALAGLHQLNPHVAVRLMLECVDVDSRADAAPAAHARYDTCVGRLAKELCVHLRGSVGAGTRIMIACTPPKEMPFKAFWLTSDGPEPCLEAEPNEKILQDD